MRRALLLSLALSLMLGARASAQTCVGMPSFANGQMQVGAGASFADGTSSFGGTFGYGSPKSFYGKAGLGSTSYDGFDGSSFDLNLGGGYQIPLQSQSTAQVCADARAPSMRERANESMRMRRMDFSRLWWCRPCSGNRTVSRHARLLALRPRLATGLP